VAASNHDAIERRAYEIWEEAGRPEGEAETHWRTAERELEAVARSEPGIPVADASQPPPKRKAARTRS
jgi:hypothetical protein